MTKLGTPIGAGPKGAIVVVGLIVVGAPPSAYCEPPSVPSGSGWSPPPLAPGAVTAPLPLSMLGLPRPSLRVTPPLPPAAPPPSISLPCSRPGLPPGPGAGAGTGSASVSAGGSGAGAEGASLESSGDSQSASPLSRRPSPSSSTPFAQAGACSEGIAVVVSGETAALSESPSAPARAVPSAVTSRKLATATISANLVLIPKHSLPTLGYPSLGSFSKLPTSTGVRNGMWGSQQGLNQGLRHPPTGGSQPHRMRLSCWKH